MNKKYIMLIKQILDFKDFLFMKYYKIQNLAITINILPLDILK